MNSELLLQVTFPLFGSTVFFALFVWRYFSHRFSEVYRRLTYLESNLEAVYERLSKLERAILEKDYVVS